MNIKETPVFVQTNDAASNQVVVFSRGEDGGLASIATHDTGGRGTGSPHLPSQGSVLAADGRVFVVNAGSDDSLSSRSIRMDWRSSTTLLRDVAEECRCTWRSRVRGRHRRAHRPPPERRRRARADRGFRTAVERIRGGWGPGLLHPERRSPRRHRAGNRRDLDLRRGNRWTPGRPDRASVVRRDPVRLRFRADGTLVVTEAFGGQVGAAAASSYRLNGSLSTVSPSVKSTRSEVCWAAVSKDGLFAYVTNFGDNTISSYRIGDDGTIDCSTRSQLPPGGREKGSS